MKLLNAMVFSDQSFNGPLLSQSPSSKMQAVKSMFSMFTRRVEQPVQSISKADMEYEIQPASDVESRKRNSLEAALETSQRKPAKKMYIICNYEKRFLNG